MRCDACLWSACPHGENCIHASGPVHVPVDKVDGGCLICAECDGDEGHPAFHDCDHQP